MARGSGRAKACLGANLLGGDGLTFLRGLLAGVGDGEPPDAHDADGHRERGRRRLEKSEEPAGLPSVASQTDGETTVRATAVQFIACLENVGEAKLLRSKPSPTSVRDGGRDRDRTCDPYHVNSGRR